MKNLILGCLIFFIGFTNAIAGEPKTYQESESSFSFKPSYNLSAGMQTRISGRTAWSSNDQGFIQFTVFLVKDSQFDYSDLAGVGLSLDTNGKTYLTISPMVLPIGHFSVFQPVFAIPITGDSLNLGFAIGYFF